MGATNKFAKLFARKIKTSYQKYWVFNNSSKIVIKSVGFMTVPAFKYCVSQWSFSEMLDSPTQNCYLLPYISESLPQQKNSWILFSRNSPATNVSQIVSWQLPLATYPPHATICVSQPFRQTLSSKRKRMSSCSLKTLVHHCFLWFVGSLLMFFGQTTMVINHG